MKYEFVYARENFFLITIILNVVRFIIISRYLPSCVCQFELFGVRDKLIFITCRKKAQYNAACKLNVPKQTDNTPGRKEAVPM
jgi:hypothetical protein